MNSINKKELQLLAAMSYGESSVQDVYEEMAGIASVLIRQRNARGYESMMTFTSDEPTYSFVVSNGNARYKQVMAVDPDDLEKNYQR